MTERTYEELLRAFAAEVAHLEPVLARAARDVLAVTSVIGLIGRSLDQIPALTGVGLTLPEYVERKTFDLSGPIAVYGAQVPASWQQKTAEPWQKLVDCWHLHNSTLLAMESCVHVLEHLLLSELDTPAHKWAQRYTNELMGTVFDNEPLPSERMSPTASPASGPPSLAVIPSEDERPELLSFVQRDPREAFVTYGLFLMTGASRDAETELARIRKERDETSDDEPQRQGLTLVPEPKPSASAPDPADDTPESLTEFSAASSDDEPTVLWADDVAARVQSLGFDSMSALLRSRPLDSLDIIAGDIRVHRTLIESRLQEEVDEAGDYAYWAYTLLIRELRATWSDGWPPDERKFRSDSTTRIFGEWARKVLHVIDVRDSANIASEFRRRVTLGWLPTLPEDVLSRWLRETIARQVNGLDSATVKRRRADARYLIEDVEPPPDASVSAEGVGNDNGGRTRHWWGLAALCAAVALILIACGVVTHRAQKRAERADARAALAIEEARVLRYAPLSLGLKRLGEETQEWRQVAVDGQVQVGNYVITVRRSLK